MENIILIGAGGHCKSVIDSILSMKKYNIYGILDNEESIGKNVCGYRVNYTDKDMSLLYEKGICKAFITVGGIGNCLIRKKLYSQVKRVGFEVPTIIDSSAVVSKFATIGEGVFIGKGSIVNADATISNMVIVNTGALVEHDCNISQFAFLSVGVHLSGGVYVGEETHIGTGVNIIQGIKIGRNSIIGAGSVVTRDIDSYKKAYGVPCKEVSSW